MRDRAPDMRVMRGKRAGRQLKVQSPDVMAVGRNNPS